MGEEDISGEYATWDDRKQKEEGEGVEWGIQDQSEVDEEEEKEEVEELEAEVKVEEGEEELGEAEAVEQEELDAEEGVIKGHKPSVVFEHSPSTVCCLSLKIWSVWLLEITHNAHSWTKWVHELIKQIREYASIIRGDVVLGDGKKKILLKSDWRTFVKDAEEKIIAWRQYSAHVKDLSISIIENFRGKKITCCPKCLQVRKRLFLILK